ncbi:TetR/AcrR family transcriptional regulator [Acinetobacter sp. B5B]|uniref:TetR/AcrR family transcriptional regulator n=1 Tax=Acinetobacter baretiae TaxID=2605383 RepID=UPI0018C1EA76|nr:TetR/AcrR family transcriptional regulator [Acinetobacter baretiae]MBF7682497.1 TetR/AcrR family transcriptional regulator [Acinetobacter baretiae]MBF7685236.1 TetR/AcrR family transcriptional regulator [Acinetobacter baretiae]
MSDSKDKYIHELPHTKRGMERCIAFLDIATDLFLKKGYDAVSLNDIIQCTGGSKASIYKFFGNKEGLFKAICDYRRDMCLQELYLNTEHYESDLRSFFLTVLKNFYDYIIDAKNIQFKRLILERATHDIDLANHLNQNVLHYLIDNIKKHLMKATEQGIIVCPNPTHSATILLGTVWHVEWQMLVGVSDIAFTHNTQEYINYCVDHFLKAHEYKQSF